MSTISTRPTVHIGQVVRNAVVFNFKNWQGTSLNTDSLLQTVSRLFSLLHERQVEYVLVGGVALLQYVEGRNTEDIDLIVAAPSLGQLPEIQIDSQDANFARGKFDDLHIDFLLTRNPLFEKVRKQHATTQHFAERDIPCATVEGLLLLKLYALPSLYRQGNFARVGIFEKDIATLLHAYRPQVESLVQELSNYLSGTELAEVREILAEIEARIQRFGRSLDESS